VANTRAQGPASEAGCRLSRSKWNAGPWLAGSQADSAMSAAPRPPSQRDHPTNTFSVCPTLGLMAAGNRFLEQATVTARLCCWPVEANGRPRQSLGNEAGRQRPGDGEPCATALGAEVMLQQTPAGVVLPFWRRWMAHAFPTLAGAGWLRRSTTVLMLWTGPGLFTPGPERRSKGASSCWTAGWTAIRLGGRSLAAGSWRVGWRFAGIGLQHRQQGTLQLRYQLPFCDPRWQRGQRVLARLTQPRPPQRAVAGFWQLQ